MRYHMLPKSNTSKEDSTEMVDVAGIDTGIFTLPREVSLCRVHREKSAEAIVPDSYEPLKSKEVSQVREGPNIELRPDLDGNPALGGIAHP